MANFFDFSSDKIDIFMLLLDDSDSMSPDRANVRKGLLEYKKNFEDFPEANSIAVSVSKFDSKLYLGEFTRVREMDTSYDTDGATALYYSIVKGAQYLLNYVKEVTERTGIIPKATFIVFSDGEPCRDHMKRSDAVKVISDLNYAGITTVFVAFGKAITSNFGAQLGFMSVKDVTEREVVVEFLGEELSNSCKEQSKSYKALGSEFFSQAANNSSSEGYSQATAQALEDDSWIDDI